MNQVLEPRVPAGGALIGEYRGWRLYQVALNGAWRSLKLVAGEPRAHKANFWLGHNGARFANSRDFATLKAYLPEIADWVSAVCAGYTKK